VSHPNIHAESFTLTEINTELKGHHLALQQAHDLVRLVRMDAEHEKASRTSLSFL